MAITHGNVKNPGDTLAAVADWNAAHAGTATPDAHAIDGAAHTGTITDTQHGSRGASLHTDSHAKQHAITTAADHTSSATSGKMLKADANGLPIDATNTDTEVAGAVTATFAWGRQKYGTTKLLHLPGVVTVGGGAVSHVSATVYYFPLLIATTIVIDAVVCEVTTPAAAGNKGRIGIYNADTDLQPTTLVVDSGEFAIDGAAVMTVAVSATLPAGRYLLALHLQANCALRSVRGTAIHQGFNPVLGTNHSCYSITVAKAYAAFSASGTAWDTPAYSSTAMNYPIFLRILTP